MAILDAQCLPKSIGTSLYSRSVATSNMKLIGAFLPRPRRGLRGIVFTRSVCVSVCLCVCLCVWVCLCVCPANILVLYFSAIRRDIDLKFIQDTYRVVLNSFQIFFMGTSWVAVSINNIKTRASSEMTSRKNIKIFDFNGVNVAKHWHVAGEVFAISDCLVD